MTLEMIFCGKMSKVMFEVLSSTQRQRSMLHDSLNSERSEQPSREVRIISNTLNRSYPDHSRDKDSAYLRWNHSILTTLEDSDEIEESKCEWTEWACLLNCHVHCGAYSVELQLTDICRSIVLKCQSVLLYCRWLFYLVSTY